MDESGFLPSNQGWQKAIGRWAAKGQYKQGGADRENVTAIVTICADGTALTPAVIFKGQNIMAKWGDNNVLNAFIAVSPNGWTDGELATKWIVEDFDHQTRDKAKGKTRVLTMDGHCSHHTEELLRLFEEIHKRAVKKGDFVEVFGKAFLEAFTEDTIQAAFQVTGIIPFNPNVITEQQMKPSLLTSTQATFPLPQHSPVRWVMAVFNSQPHTAFDVSPDNHNIVHIPAGGSVSAPQTPPIPSGLPVSMPQTPTCTAVAAAPPILDSAINPSLFTPSKRGRIFIGSLASRNSAVFLVGSTKITSSTCA
ncbi:hypothetical protein PILCRDRAFT_3567 [Piloderma croceum F 1598]|uniref:DDE-1 domain-containing protein n=1 Tax=Piloderma croceum (strain F 1598) TaxID=765440 RepID=A0A0C3BMX9_PILCF|nr:hypothetical protein PILCRDRAFT_3567 [Piloderma croceum F 1598]